MSPIFIFRRISTSLAVVITLAVAAGLSLPEPPATHSRTLYKSVDRIAMVISSDFNNLAKTVSKGNDFVQRVSPFISLCHQQVLSGSPFLRVNRYERNEFYVLASINAP